jgi:CheY-like chemotaxis protein
MFKLLLVSPDKDALSDFAAALAQHGDVEFSWAESGQATLRIASTTPLDLIITAETLGDMTGLELAGRLLTVNPMINCASVSRLSPDQFHELSEGLGIMGHLPVQPGPEHAEELLQRLKYIKGFTDDLKD